MKQYILSLVILLFLTSCQEHKSKRQEQPTKDGVSAQLATENDDTLFLGLHFGMNEVEVFNYFYDLENQGELHLVPHKYFSDNRKIFIYEFDYSQGTPLLQNVHATFRTYYIQDKLYKLRINVESEEEKNIELLLSNLIETYISKYGNNYVKKEYTLNNSGICTWVDGNKMIEICEGFNNNVLIIYTDILVARENKEIPKQTIMREQ